MGTNGTNDDDLFDDIADSFFRQGEEGFGDDWGEDAEPAAPSASAGAEEQGASEETTPPQQETAPTPVSPPTAADRSLFSAPTVILPAGQRFADDEDAPQVAAAPPPASAPAPSENFHEETLFDAGLDGDMFGDLGGGTDDDTREVFDAPTEEATPEMIRAMLAAPTIDTSISESSPEPPLEQPVDVEDEDLDDGGLEASADDFVDMLGPDPSLILRRSASLVGESGDASADASEPASEEAHGADGVSDAAAVEEADVLAPIPSLVPPAMSFGGAAPPAPVAPAAGLFGADTVEDTPSQVSETDPGAPPQPAPKPQGMDAIDGAPAGLDPQSSVFGQESAAVLSLRAPVDAGEGWAELRARIEGLALRTDGPASAEYAAEAGRLAMEQLGDAEGAATLLARAVGGGVSDPAVLAAYSMAVGAIDDHERLRDLLVRRADGVGGAAKAMLLQDAALVERHQLSREQAAVQLLEQSLEASDDPTSQWFGLRLLRDMHIAAARWESASEVMERMASLAVAAEAAVIWVELGAIREEHLNDREGALSAYLSAIEGGSTDPQAVVGAERCATRSGNPRALIALFGQLAERSEGLDAGVWYCRQARACANAGDASGAVDGWQRAAELGVPSTMRHEGLAFLASQSRWAELHTALRAEADRDEGARAAWARMWAAEVALDQLSEPALALEDLEAVLVVEPTSVVARERLVDAHLDAGQPEQAIAVLSLALDVASNPNEELHLHFQMAEVCEQHCGDLERARTHFARVVEISRAYLPALDGLERCAAQLGDWASVVEVHEQRSLLHEANEPASGHLLAAAWVAESGLADTERALDLFERALVAAPGCVNALDGVVRTATALGRPDRAAAALQSAASATDDEVLGVSMLYRLARLQGGALEDADSARATLRECVTRSPAFRPASVALAAMARKSGSWVDVVGLEASIAEQAETAEEQIGRLLVAARAARRAGDPREPELIQAALRVDRNHPAARAEADLRAVFTGDLGVRRALVHDAAAAAESAPLYAVLTDILTAMGEKEAAVSSLSACISAGGGDSMPGNLAAVAVRLGDWESATQLVEAAEDWTVLGTLHSVRRNDAEAAMAAWSKVPGDPVAGRGLARLAVAGGNREALAEAYRRVASTAQTPGIRGVHAVLAGRLATSLGNTLEAVEAYRLGMTRAPVRDRVSEGLLHVLADAGEADAVGELLDTIGAAWDTERAELLAEAGAHQAAAFAFATALEDTSLSDAARVGLLARQEHALTEAEDWQGVMDSLRAQAALLEDATTLADLGARQRWILAEKLADTDDAWEQYQSLHQQDPGNAEVLEALARIAGARGLTDEAIAYLSQLSEIAPDNQTAARYRRRAAEVHRIAGNTEQAQQELSQAIELNPEDTESMLVLRDLATEQGDWNAVVGVLAREASVLDGSERDQRLRNIARIWEDQLAEPAVAMDAWRKVLDESAGDEEALSRLVQLSRDVQDWTTFAHVAAARIEQLAGEEQAVLQADLGMVLIRHLYREEEAVRYLDESSRGDTPQLAAARELERIHSASGHWDRAVDAMRRQAAASDGEAKVETLLRAARVCIDSLQKRDVASEIYGEVLALDPANLVALRFQADHLYQAEDLAAVVAVFEKLEQHYDSLDIEDEDEDDVIDMVLSLFRFAQTLEKLGRTDEAIRRYEAVCAINPSHLPSLEAVGPLYMAAGEWAKAGGMFRQLLRLTGGEDDPARLARTYNALGRVELELGNLDKSERRFAKALQVRPNDATALSGSAEVLLRRGDTLEGEEQTEAWRRLLTLYNQVIYHAQTSEEVVRAYLTKGFVLDARLGLADKAAQHFRKSLAFVAEQPDVLLRLGEHALRDQDWPEAESLASRGLALDSLSSEQRAGLHLVRYCAFAVCGDGQAADAELQAAIDTGTELALGLGAGDPGASAVHEALRARLQARL